MIALLARLQPFLDRVGELGLAGVVGDLAVDTASRELLSSVQIALISAWLTALAVDHQADAAGEHLLADAARVDVDAEVVVARLVSPRPGGVVAGERVDRVTRVS